MSRTSGRLPTLYIPHGGGPCFFMETPPGLPPGLWDGMAAYLRGIDASIGQRPKSVLVISGHWETERPTVNVAMRPPLLFDYYGFPEHTYRLTYPVAGSPQLATRVRELLAAAEIASADSTRRSSWVPPWTMPKRAWRAGPFSACQATQRSSQRWVRSVERAV